MITSEQYKHFLDLAAADHGGMILGLNPYRSSITPVLTAMERYVQAPGIGTFQAIGMTLDRMPDDRKRKYARAIKYLRGVLGENRNEAQQLETRRRLRQNHFRVTSNAKEYAASFGNEFEAARDKLGANNIWVDGGAGQAKAMRAFAQTSKATCIAFAFDMPIAARQEIEKAADNLDNFSYLEIGYFEKTELAVIAKPGTCDLITDLNGVLYYTMTYAEALRRYIDLLKIGGSLFFTRSTVEFILTKESLLESSEPVGDTETLDIWLNKLKGVKFATTNTGAIQITRLQEECAVPVLQLVKTNRLGGVTGNEVARTYVYHHD